MKVIKVKFTDIGKWWALKDYILDNLKGKYSFIEDEQPDYVFGGSLGKDILNYSGIRIQIIGENMCPDFNLYDYAIGFNHIFFEDRYIRYPLYAIANYRDEFLQALNKHITYDKGEYEKRKFCCFVVSNPNGKNDFRTEMFFRLNKYKQVDSGGQYLNNIGTPIGVGLEAKKKFMEQYRFCIAMENSSTLGYTTEKIVEAWVAGAIPVYWGNPEISKEFNAKAFINCHDFKSIEEVVNKIIEIDQSPELYRKMLQEPIVIPGVEAEKYIREEDLKGFLIHIFEQSKEKAYRRSSYYSGQGKHYEEMIKKNQSKCVRKQLGKGVEKIIKNIRYFI